MGLLMYNVWSLWLLLVAMSKDETCSVIQKNMGVLRVQDYPLEHRFHCGYHCVALVWTIFLRDQESKT